MTDTLTRRDEMTVRGYTTNMKPCPFCDGTKLETRRAVGSYWFHYVVCLSCRVEGPHIKETGSVDATAMAAIADWNTR